MGFRRVRISEFRGIDTHKGMYHDDLSTSPNATNFVCHEGILMTAGGTKPYTPELPVQGSRLFQAFFRDAGQKGIILASGAGNLYALKGEEWVTIGSGYASDEWEAVNYRSGEEEKILLVNGVDGMAAWNGADEQAEIIYPSQGGEEIAFQHLTLLYERLWGAVHTSAPDRVYWSESFSPEDWETNYDTPDAGGGFVDVATFDGSRIRAIVSAFDDVLIFKDKSMHRLNGTYPGEFNLTQVYGAEGTLAPRTIVHTADRLYFLGTDGLCVYNGMSVSTLAHAGDGRMNGVWERMNRSAISGACAAILEDVLYLALPLDGSEENNHVLQYGMRDKSWSITEVSGVTDMLTIRDENGERLLILSGNEVLEYGKGETVQGEKVEASWLSPVVALNTLTAKRTVGRMCFLVEAHALSGKPGMKLTLVEKNRRKTREVQLQEGANLVRQRIRIRGRTFQFQIENMNGCRLALPDGLEIVLEEESDL